MIRLTLILLALGVGFDHYKFSGKYSDAAERTASHLLTLKPPPPPAASRATAGPAAGASGSARARLPAAASASA